MKNKQSSAASRARIFESINKAAVTVEAAPEVIQQDALAILDESVHARPLLLAEDAAQALTRRIESGLVIGTSCEAIASLNELPATVSRFLNRNNLPPALQVQNKALLQALNWQGLTTEVDIHDDNTVGLCWAEYGIAETGSFVVHSSADMPVLLNFLPLYLIAVVPQSKILPYMDDYALIANEIALNGNTPRNMSIISGASGTTDIEGVLVQGAHGPEILHLVIIEDK